MNLGKFLVALLRLVILVIVEVVEVGVQQLGPVGFAGQEVLIRLAFNGFDLKKQGRSVFSGYEVGESKELQLRDSMNQLCSLKFSAVVFLLATNTT